MKNFIYHHMGEYDGATIEGFLEYVGAELLDTYSQMEAVAISADELPFDERSVPSDDGFEPSELVFGVEDGPAGYGELYLTRTTDGTTIEEQTSGVTGIDRTLYLGLDVLWTYADTEHALGTDTEAYVPAEQVRDIAQVVFDELDVNSIQQLIYRIGQRVLRRFPQLESVRFEANNRTWIGVRDDLEGDGKVLREPPRPTGFQQFSMDRSDLDTEAEE